MKSFTILTFSLFTFTFSLAAVETPTMGWSSWNAYRVNISENIISKAADMVVELGLDKVGYVYINTDDGYFGGRDENGKLKTHPKRFPNGLKGMVDHIHGLGLKAGIYSDGGENTCGSIWDHDELGVGVGMWQHDQQDADYFFKELDFDFIKIDFCGGLAKGNTAKVDMDPKERYTAIRQAAENAKPGVRINVCRWDYPGTWVGTIGSSWRISPDVELKWTSVNDIIHQNLYLSAYAGPGAFNDMDMLEVGRGLPEEEDKTHFGIWCIMNSPLLIGCDLAKTREDPVAMELLKNTELIALNQDPLCQQAYVVKRDGEKYVLVKDLEVANGKVRAVALLNTEDAAAEMSVDFRDLDLAGRVQVRDLFAHADLPAVTEKLTASVPAHGTRIFKLTAETRLERTKYEAETAWLSTYQELVEAEKAGTAYYRQDPKASGGVVATGVGGKGGYLEWRNVVCDTEGLRELTLKTTSYDEKSLKLTVNGVPVSYKANSCRCPSNFGVYHATVPMKKGANVVRVSGDERLPDIDCLEVCPSSVVETPTMGWSSWNAYRVNISEGTIKRAADLVVELGLDKLGYVYINTDDGYFGGRDKDGKLITHPKRFPNGLKGMVDHIHGLGLKAGIYSDGGENTCGSICDNDELGKGVGMWQHDQQDADYFFKELDFDFIKIDFCGGLKRGNTAKIDMDPKERYTAIRQAVDKAKPGVRINVCRWDYPGTWVGTIGSSWRMSHDVALKWSSVNDIIHQNLYLSAYAGPGAFNDMDMLEVGRGLPEEEDKTHFGIWCIMNSPLLIGCDLAKTREDPAAMALLKNTELIALDQDPLCQQAYVAKRDGETYVLVKDLQEANGRVRAVAFLNTTDAGTEMSVSLKDLDLAGRVHVRDLFAHLDLPAVTDEMKVTVPAHGTRIYRLVADTRLEREVYEAETAWLSTYQELHDAEKAGTAYYRQSPKLSGGVVASNVGGKDNYLEWQKVNSAVEGERELVLITAPGDEKSVKMSVNGVEAPLKRITCSCADDEVKMLFAATVPMKKGDNVVRIYGDKRLPDIDRLDLQPLK